MSLWAAGCGSSAGPAPAGSATNVALDMKAGGNAYDVQRCGVSHHYTTYRVGQRIEYGGTVTPAPTGRWEVKLKVERCTGQGFRTVQQAHTAGQAHGYASGVVRGLPSGHYFGRLYYYGAAKSSESDKEYFLLRPSSASTGSR